MLSGFLPEQVCIKRFCKRSALFMNNSETREKSGKDQADIKGASTTQYARRTAIAYATGDCFAKTLNLDLFRRFTIRGTIVKPSPKNQPNRC